MTCRSSSSHFFIRGSLSSSQERQPSLRSPQPASLKSRPARVPSQGWQKNRKLCAQTRELSFGSAQLSPRIAPLLSGTRHVFPHCSTSLVEWHDFFAASYDFFCCIARFLLLHHSISFAFPRLTLRSPPTRQPPPPSFIHNVLSSYVYLPSIRYPRRPLRHESRYRRRSPRCMGPIGHDRRTTAAHRQRIARCTN